jgi:hypothetical protein
MHQERSVDPISLYKDWEPLSAALDPRRLTPSSGLAGVVETTMSVLSARQSVWAVMCLATAYASRTDGNAVGAISGLAAADIGDWPGSVDIARFSDEFDRLGWSPSQLIQGAQTVAWTLPVALVTLAAITITDYNICRQLHGDDPVKIDECLKKAAEHAQVRQFEQVSLGG